ncbi:hypothetical protein NO221_00250, partial [Gluconacetobacter entanii]|nr:hypothetical protein [Gluconacetobacter entanii]MCW4582270.1 hypothetical protein [Gluconacetobacter entanii]MCW4585652.1 hypothetical protein [Gluconacetobacter entanii]
MTTLPLTSAFPLFVTLPITQEAEETLAVPLLVILPPIRLVCAENEPSERFVTSFPTVLDAILMLPELVIPAAKIAPFSAVSVPVFVVVPATVPPLTSVVPAV